MELSADATMPFPRSLVYAAYRDDMLNLVPYLPNIRRIEVRKREQEGTLVRLLNIWHGGGEIPKVARAFISDNMLSWTDHALWVEDDYYCDWRIETHSFVEAVTCGGRNRFVEVDGGTRLEIRGKLEIDATKIHGVPRFLSGKVGRMVEEFLVAKIQPNLVEVSQGLRRYLEDGRKPVAGTP